MKYKLTTATAGNWHKLDPDLAPEPVLVSSNTVSITAYNTSLDLTEDVSSVDWSLFMDLSPGDSGSYTSSYWWRVWDCQQTAFAIWGRANIPWTQEHVDVFHNDGNYVQYADL